MFRMSSFSQTLQKSQFWRRRRSPPYNVSRGLNIFLASDHPGLAPFAEASPLGVVEYNGVDAFEFGAVGQVKAKVDAHHTTTTTTATTTATAATARPPERAASADGTSLSSSGGGGGDDSKMAWNEYGVWLFPNLQQHQRHQQQRREEGEEEEAMEVLFTIRPLEDFEGRDQSKALANTSQLVRRLEEAAACANEDKAMAALEVLPAAAAAASNRYPLPGPPASSSRPPRFIFCTAPSSLPPFTPPAPRQGRYHQQQLTATMQPPPPGLLHWSPSLPAAFAHRALFAQDTRWAPVPHHSDHSGT